MPRKRYTSLSFEEAAYWVRTHLPEMTFKRNPRVPSICTIWIENDPHGEKVALLVGLLIDFLGAYQTGPSSNWEGAPPHESFGFWNQGLLDNARRIFPLPGDLAPGPVIYLNSVSETHWQRLEAIYDIQVTDLPRR